MDQAKQAVDSVVEGVKKVAISKDTKGPKDGKKGGKKEKKPGKETSAAGGPALSEINPRPSFIDERLVMFDELKKKEDELIAKKPRDAIMITMPDGTIKPGKAWETTPREIAEGISKSLYKRACIAKVRVEGEEPTLWDLERPLEKSCKLEILDFSSADGKKVFWHSSAHALGEASERCYGCLLSRGPPTEDGFYYDMSIPGDRAVQQADWQALESLVGKIAKEKQKFERLEMDKKDLLKMFDSNEFKRHYIDHNVPDGTRSTVYRNGPFIDFCRGPHIPDTGRIEAFAVMRNSATYFLGDSSKPSLQRIAGVSFPSKKEMQEHKKILEEAAKRDHRRIGKEQELFFFHPFSPGSAFFQPHGMRIYDAIVDLVKEEYWAREYHMVKSPNIYSQDLFEQSGHWYHYREDMFHWAQEEDMPPPEKDGKAQPAKHWCLKPMNCPGHCLIFRERDRSWRDLPFRVAEFGVLHRNEASGALSGLTRVRRFEQDDSHIFCTEDQIKSEMDNLFDFLQKVYGTLQLGFRLRLSTRNPDKFMGSIETWDRAESMLKESLDAFSKNSNVQWELNEGDGAFYGPKIDIAVLDALGRGWQCATLQLDFLNPENFSLEYNTGESPEQIKQEVEEGSGRQEASPEDTKAGAEDGEKRYIKPLTHGSARPVMIHRAIAGSVERFIGILTEHFAGKWPFWLSPRQVLVIPVGKGYFEYAEEVRRVCRRSKLYTDVDLSGEVLKKKVLKGQLAGYNYIFIVGNDEMEGRKVNVRFRDDTSTQDRGTPLPLDEAVKRLKQLKEERGKNNPLSSNEGGSA